MTYMHACTDICEHVHRRRQHAIAACTHACIDPSKQTPIDLHARFLSLSEIHARVCRSACRTVSSVLSCLLENLRIFMTLTPWSPAFVDGCKLTPKCVDYTPLDNTLPQPLMSLMKIEKKPVLHLRPQTGQPKIAVKPLLTPNRKLQLKP